LIGVKEGFSATVPHFQGGSKGGNEVISGAGDSYDRGRAENSEIGDLSERRGYLL